MKDDPTESCDQRMGINSGEKRSDRQDLVSQAHPQSGVDDLGGKFSQHTKSIPGVDEKQAHQ